MLIHHLSSNEIEFISLKVNSTDYSTDTAYPFKFKATSTYYYLLISYSDCCTAVAQRTADTLPQSHSREVLGPPPSLIRGSLAMSVRIPSAKYVNWRLHRVDFHGGGANGTCTSGVDYYATPDMSNSNVVLYFLY